MSVDRVSADTMLAGHEAEPIADTMYSMVGPNAGLRADLRRPGDYPVTAHCGVCGMMLRIVWYRELGVAGWWQHEGRKPGQS